MYTRFRRYALDGVFTRALQQIQAHADAAGDIDWLVQIDSTIVRAHQHAAATGRKKGGGAASAGRTGRSCPRPIPRRTDHEDSPRLRRQGPPPRAPGDARTTPRQCLRTPSAGTDPCSPHRPGPASVQARPGHSRQGLQLPRLPCLPAKTRHCAHHPGEDRPATAPAEARWPTARVRPGDLPAAQHDRALLQPAQGLPRYRHQIRKDRHFLRSGGHSRIVPALGKIRLKTDPSEKL